MAMKISNDIDLVFSQRVATEVFSLFKVSTVILNSPSKLPNRSDHYVSSDLITSKDRTDHAHRSSVVDSSIADLSKELGYLKGPVLSWEDRSESLNLCLLLCDYVFIEEINTIYKLFINSRGAPLGNSPFFPLSLLWYRDLSKN